MLTSCFLSLDIKRVKAASLCINVFLWLFGFLVEATFNCQLQRAEHCVQKVIMCMMAVPVTELSKNRNASDDLFANGLLITEHYKTL